MAKRKENTDITGVAVEKVPTVNENIKLSDMSTLRSHLINSRKKTKDRRHRNAQVRVNRLLKDFE